MSYLREPMRDRLLLAAAGAAWLLTQYVATREIGSTFFATELTALAAVLVTMIGPSVGYALGKRLSSTFLLWWGGLSVAGHLILPVGLRALVGALAARGFEAWALGVTLTAGSVLLCGFYAVFLPRCTRDPTSLGRLYAAELTGALAALLLLIASPSWRVTLGAHALLAVLVVHLGLRRRVLTALTALCAGAMILAYPRLDVAAAQAYFRGYHGHARPRLVATAYSAYQRIDVVDDDDGRSLYLDGVAFFRAGDLDAFNVFLADVPAALRRSPSSSATRSRALVMGSGSFSSAAFAARRGYAVTVVEIDPEVARLGFERFATIHRLGPTDFQLVVDDGRRFLERAPPGSFDLVVLDVPAPYHVRTALLHTPRFYRAVARVLAPGGVVALSLCDDPEGAVGRSIIASAVRVFSEVLIVDSEAVGLGLLYGGVGRVPFDVDQLRRELQAREPGGGEVHDDAAARRMAGSTPPIEESRLAAVLWMARGALP
jgi:spermidine synthase